MYVSLSFLPQGEDVSFMIYFMQELSYSDVTFSLLSALTYIASHIILVYLHYYLILPILRRGNRWRYFFGVSSVIIAFSLLLSKFEYEVSIFYEYEFYFWGDFIYNVLLLTMMVAVASLYYFVEAWYHNIKRESQLENEKLQAELNFLKSQINPHFLFNTLNNIYAYAQTGNPRTAPMLERLSSILRFMVYVSRVG